MAAENDTLVRFIEVQKSYDGETLVVKNLNLDVARGEFLTMLGPSGSGKTTCLMMLAGFEPATHGEITLDGVPINNVPPHKRDIGMVFQNYALFPHMTVAENLAFPLQVRKIKKPEIESRVNRALDMVQLGGFGGRRPAQLSGGQQQRVALLRALAPTPRVLLLDEPFSGLDVNRRAQIRQDTFQILSQAGIATLMVTHDPEEAMFMADRILVMRGGRIVQAGRPMDIYFKPEDAFVAELFGPINALPGQVSGSQLQTPLGAFPAGSQQDGATVRVLIRPEALVLSLPAESAQGPALTVMSARSLGRSTHLTLLLEDGAEGTVLSARMPGVFLPDVGSRVHAQVAAESLLVFPAE